MPLLCLSLADPPFHASIIFDCHFTEFATLHFSLIQSHSSCKQSPLKIEPYQQRMHMCIVARSPWESAAPSKPSQQTATNPNLSMLANRPCTPSPIRQPRPASEVRLQFEKNLKKSLWGFEAKDLQLCCSDATAFTFIFHNFFNSCYSLFLGNCSGRCPERSFLSEKAVVEHACMQESHTAAFACAAIL